MNPARPGRTRRRLGALAVAVAVTAAACASDTDDSGRAASTTAPTAVPGTTATTAQAPPGGIDFAAASGIAGGDPTFNFSALVWQGYWLSRDHFGPFVMASGLGIPFEPPADMMQAAMGMVARNPDDPVVIPRNMAPLQAVYASADPRLVNDPREFEPLDFEAFRLDPDTFDETVRVRAQAQTMLKESQWAHNFADPHFGTPDGDFGAQQRFMGQMVALLAQMQGRWALENLAGDDGLFVDSDGTVDPEGNWVLLHALADVALLTGGDVADGRYANPDAAAMFTDATRNLFDALADRDPAGATEAAAAVRALVYVASVDDTLADDALDRAGAIAEALAADDPTTVADLGAALATVVSAAAAGAGTPETLDDAARRWFAALEDAFDPATGAFEGTDRYTVDDVAWIIGGLNSLVQQGPPELVPDAARMLLAFYEATVSVAGMQLSAPPGKDGAMAGDWEKDLPAVNYYHPENTPPPPVAGTLPVPAAEVTFTDGTWAVSDDTFDVAGAMHLANELNWLGPHLGSRPFPLAETRIEPPVEPGGGEGASAPAGGELRIVGENISFDVDRLEVPAGEEVTIVFDNRDDGIPHNLHLQAGAVDVKTEITPGPVTQELTFTVDEPGTWTLICDVHPTQMRAELVVTG